MHAYLIIAHNQFELLERLICCIDDERNDIYIHIDSKATGFDKEKIIAAVHQSSITFTNRIHISWGGFDMVRCEYILLEAAFESGKHYDYIHLNSGVVLPLEPLWNIFTITNKVKQSSIYLAINSMLTIGIVFALLQFAQTEYQKMLIIVGVSTAFSIIRALTFLPLFGAKCLGFKLNTFYKPELRNVFAVAILTLISFVIKSMVKVDSWLMLIVVSCATMAMSVFINYFLVLGKNERIILKNKLFSLFNKKTTSNYKDGV